MKHIAIIKQSLILVAGLLAALLTSCIKDDLAECSKLTLKVEGLSGNEITDITRLGLVTDATLYIFDANKNFLEARDLDKDFILAKMRLNWISIRIILNCILWLGVTWKEETKLLLSLKIWTI